MLQVDLPTSYLENPQKHAMLIQTDSNVISLLFNFSVKCKEGTVVKVNALDMISVSEFFECAIVKYKYAEVSLPYSKVSMAKLLTLIYMGWGEYDTVQEVIDLHSLTDYLGIEYCSRALMAALRKHLKRCSLGEVLRIHDVGEEHMDQKLSLMAIDILLDDYKFEDICEDVALHCEVLFAKLVSSDRLDIVSELILARHLIRNKVWKLLQHVRVEHMHGLELASLLKDQTLCSYNADFGHVLREEACCRLENKQNSPQRLPRGLRYIWLLEGAENVTQLVEFPGFLNMYLVVDNGKMYVLTSLPADFTVYYSVQFCEVSHSSPTWEEAQQWYRHYLVDLVLSPKQSHMFCVQVNPRPRAASVPLCPSR